MTTPGCSTRRSNGRPLLPQVARSYELPVWRNQFGGLKADDAKRLKELERKNSTLKRLLAEAELEKAALKEIAKGEF